MNRLRAAALAAAAGCALVQGCATPEGSAGLPDVYTVVQNGHPASAQSTAKDILRHLAAGELREAAARSNAPERRFEVLDDYRNAVGDEEFRRVYAQYTSPPNRILKEVALGERRLVIWDLVNAGGRLAGQYFVLHEGKFLLDDVPSEERKSLQHVLQACRKARAAGRDC